MELLKKLLEKYTEGELKEKLRNDPVFFTKEIIGIPINEYQIEWVNLVHENKRVNITAFRSSGKTELLFIDYFTFKAFTIPSWEGIIVSDSLRQSTSVLRRIKDHITSNEMLRTAIPSNRSAMWSKTGIELKNGSKIFTLPYSEKLRGYHVDMVGCDEAGEYRDHMVFFASLTPVITAKDGKILVVGTPTSQIDLLHELRKNKAYESRVYPVKTSKHNFWKMRYPNRSLEQLKIELNNNLAFSREYMCRPLGAGSELFPYKLIEQSFDYEAVMLDKARPGSYIYFIGLDFALSGRSGADFSVFTVFERDTKNVVRLVKMERYKGMSIQWQKERVRQLNTLFKPVKILADEGYMGKAFIQEMLVEHLPIRGFNFQNMRQQLLEIFRGAFQVNFNENEPKLQENKKFFLPYNRHDIETKKLIDVFVEELMAFAVKFKVPKGGGDVTGKVVFESTRPHDDTVMSAALGYWIARGSTRSSLAVARGNFLRRGSLFSKT